MFIARVKGHVVATAKDASIKGQKLLLVEPLKVEYPAATSGASGGSSVGGGGRFAETGRAIVVMDPLGAGEGQLVLITQGSSARMAEGCGKLPTDAVIVGIVDQALIGGQQIT